VGNKYRWAEKEKEKERELSERGENGGIEWR
jgi:hypothetical protein